MTAFTRNRALGMALLALAAIVSNAARGDVLVSTLADPFRFDTPIGNNPNPVPPPVGLWNWAAQSFSTDNYGYTLTSIEAMVGTGDAAPGVIAQLRADDINAQIDLSVGGLLGSFASPGVSGGQSVRSFAPVAGITLTPNTTYWFLLGSSNDGTYAWSYAEGGDYTGPGSIRQEQAVADSQDSGVSWNYHALGSSAYFFQVNVNLATDPSLLAQWAFDQSGDWNSAANWSPATVPNSSSKIVTFGAAITSAATVFTNSAVTAKQITFDNANSYIIAGAGSVNLQADTGNATLHVAQGTHEFQARVNLLSDTDASIAAGATLEFNNRLDLGGKTLTKSGAGALHVNNVLNTGGGSIVVLAGLLGGSGSIAGNLTNTSGTVAPGNSPGKLSIQGSFTQAPSGSLSIELGGTAVWQFDVLQVDQFATLGGTLAVSLVNGFQPHTGDFFNVVTTGGGTFGTSFSAITGNDLSALSAGFKLNLITDVLNVGLLAALPGDANLNQSTDFADLGILLNNYNQAVAGGQGEWGLGDFNDDHLVDFTDLGILLNNYNQSVSLSASSTAVPEPSTLVLAAIGLIGVGMARRRRPRT